MADINRFYTAYGAGTYNYTVPATTSCQDKVDLINQFKALHPQQANFFRFLVGVCSDTSSNPTVEINLNEINDNGDIVHKIAQMVVEFTQVDVCFDICCRAVKGQP
jgi:hypothetical protein